MRAIIVACVAWRFCRARRRSGVALNQNRHATQATIMAATLFYVLALLCFSLLAGLHFRLQAAKFSCSLSMVLNCGNFKGDVDNCGDLGYFILVIRVLNFRQSRRQNL